MSGRSPRLRALRPRSQINPKAPQKQRVQSVNESYSEEGADISTNQLNDLELENNDARGDSDSDEPRLVIKEEPEDNVTEDKNPLDRKYECKSCKPALDFSNLIEYLQHLKDQHQQKSVRRGQTNKIASDAAEPNKCTMCSFVAVNPSEMESHQRLHHLKRRFFRCSKCSYMTHVRARYTKHVKYHSMPMIKCDDCDFRTPYKWNLDRHTRNHGGGGPFHCRACNFTADIRQSLTVHEMNHHDPPVGVSSKKPIGAFERKSRNGPKRYNQVGGSDFRDRSKSPSEPDASDITIPEKSSNEEIIENSMDVDAAEAIAGVDCIALKCEENGCQFITAWDSEMQRHLIEEHGGPQTPSKSRKPLPMLIPLSPGSKTTTTPPLNGSPSNLLNVPRVRVRPELAKIARDTEIAKLYGTRESPSPKKEIAVNSFEKRNAIFFDKLKERLVATSATNGVTQVAVSNINDLKCWCTFEANCSEELANHKKTHHTALSVTQGVSRCPKCQKRCKSLIDLQMHVQVCQLSINNLNDNDSSQEITVNSDTGHEATSHSNEFEFPFQVDWDGSYGGLNSSGSSVDGLSHPSTTTRRVFKCPHCPFWASTASRFHVHIVGHLNRKPFECSLCAYRSNWRWDITKHIKLKSARDPAHMNARVLMTDETGRRNYSKYNKYLAQMEHQGPDDPSLEESQGEFRGDEPTKKLFITTNSSSLGSPDFGASRMNARSIKVLSIDVNSPTPKKQTPNILRNQGQSLLKINPSTSTPKTAESITPSTSAKETKRTLWKCKKCHFRDSSKEMVLIHVKSHYESSQQSRTNSKNTNSELACSDCPFIATDATTLAMHKVHHRPNLEAIFKCYLCPYYVRTKAELLEHIHLHGEELAIDHQQKEPSSPKLKSPTGDSETVSMEEVTHSTPPSSILITDTLSDGQAPPLLLDTRALPDTPMVWVSSNDGIFSKMLKCRHCPHVSSRRAGIRDHETMHIENPDSNSLIACPDCSFCCGQRDVMEAHAGMHVGSQGKVHCLIDDSRTDAQQLADIKSLLGLEKTPVMGAEPDLRDSRLVHFCGMCPARFLCEKELRIHLRYHSTVLAYSCEWCSYAARQPAHLLAHQKAHSTEYQERSRYLSGTYGNSERYPPPMTACVEAKNQTGESDKNIAWIVVEVSPKANANRQNGQDNDERNASEVFTCEKCPARYFKLDALEYHMTLHGSNNRFKCVDCDYSSKTAQNLLKHQVVHKRHSESSEPTVSRLQASAEPQYGTFMRGNPNFVYPGYVRNGRIKEKRYKCHKCPSAFEKRDQYKIHLALHGSKQRYRCETCDYAVKYYANYVQHVKKHQVNAQAQASRRQMEPADLDCDDIGEEDPSMPTKSRRKSTISSGSTLNSTAGSHSEDTLPVSNQDKQTTLLMQRKVGVFSTSEMAGGLFNTFKCLECPFSASEKDAIDAHKRRHGIERLTPPCPHCNYVPRKDENVGDHIRLHFTRLYKPEGYLIVELLSLRMKRADGSKDEKDKENDLLFSECEGGQFLPATDISSLSAGKTGKGVQEKVIVDPNTGETTHRFKV